MKRIVLTYGLLGGVIVSVLMLSSISIMGCGWEYGMLAGYTTMVIALSSIFFAVKAYRDNHLGGSIGFGKAFVMGLYITLVTSTLYVASWMVYSSTMEPDFMTQYIGHMEQEMKSAGKSEAEMTAELKDMRDFAEAYKNPVVKAGATYMEILPVGLLVSLLCAALLKRSSSSMHDNFARS